MKKIALMSVLALIAVVGCGPQEPVIKVGFVAPLTGDQAAHGTDMQHGAELALQQAGEVLSGYKLELVALDDARNPAQAVSAAKRLVSDPQVLFIIGHLNSSCTMPASAIYNEAGLLHINPVSSNPDISKQGFKTFYRICPTDDLQGPAGARFAVKNLNAKKIFVLDDLTTYGRGLANEFVAGAKREGAEILGHEGITQGEKDFTPILTKIKAQAPDLVYFAGMFPEAALLIKQRYALGLKAAFMGGDGLFEPSLIELATPEMAEGVYITTLGSDIKRVPSAQAFVQDFTAAFGQPGAYSSYVYEGTLLGLEAVRKAGVADRAKVLAAMQQLSGYKGILGQHVFDAKGDTTIRTIGIYQVQDGQFSFLEAIDF